MNPNPRATTVRLLTQWKDVQDSLTLMDSIGLALRRQRNVARTSQREYALQSGWSKSHQARLETDPGRLKLADVLAALEGTSYHLELRSDDDGRLVEPFEWYPTELVARFRDGRRFPAAVNPVRWTGRTWFYTRHPYGTPAPDWTWSRR